MTRRFESEEEADVGFGLSCVCVCLCARAHRVEANGKHYMAGGYVFAPLSFAALEAAGEEE